jgi:hypothetical protein
MTCAYCREARQTIWVWRLTAICVWLLWMFVGCAPKRPPEPIDDFTKAMCRGAR